jgi:hypothetical protein
MTTYRITPVQHFNSQWLWFAARSHDWAATTPTFLVAKANRRGAPYAGANLAVWSTAADTDAWNKFDNQSTGATDIEFSNDDAFPDSLIYVSYLPMYPFSRVQRKMGQWAASDARIVETASTTNFIISNLTARATMDGRTAPALPLYGFKLTNVNANTKNNMILTAGNHPDETQGSHQLEGAIDWLLGGSADAELLLDWFNVYVYPCINPQGVWSGYFRSSPQTAASDNNRLWNTTGTNEAVDALKTAWAADTGGVLEVGIDFHGDSFTSAPAYFDSEDHTETLYAAYLAEMQGYIASFSYTDDATTSKLNYLWRHTYSAKLSINQESMCLAATDFPAAWKTNGQYTMQSIANMLADGDFTNGP